MHRGFCISCIKALSLCLPFLLMSCENSTAPDTPDAPEIVLTIVPGDEEIWSGETILFTVHSSVPLGEDVTYEWDFGMEQQVGNPVVELRSTDTVTHTFTMVGTRTIHVTAKGSNAKAGSEPVAYLTVTINETTNTLRIEPGQLLWDAGYEQLYSIKWGNRLPPEYTVRWDFGDGTQDVRGGEAACPHIYRDPGEYVISARLLAGDPDSVLGSATARVTITEPTPGRYLRFEIRDAEMRYSYRETYRSNTTIYEDSLVWRCDSTLLWEGNRFSCNIRRMGRDWPLGRPYLAEGIAVEGVLESGVITELELTLINVYKGFGYDSLWRSAVLQNIRLDPSRPNSYSVTGKTAIDDALTGLEMYQKINRMSYTGTVTREKRLEFITSSAQSILRVTIGH